jgi:hemerythrin-like domain-containing protein
MIPWEREIYLELLRQHIENENNRIANQQNLQRAFNSRGRI